MCAQRTQAALLQVPISHLQAAFRLRLHRHRGQLQHGAGKDLVGHVVGTQVFREQLGELVRVDRAVSL